MIDTEVMRKSEILVSSSRSIFMIQYFIIKIFSQNLPTMQIRLYSLDHKIHGGSKVFKKYLQKSDKALQFSLKDVIVIKLIIIDIFV